MEPNVKDTCGIYFGTSFRSRYSHNRPVLDLRLFREVLFGTIRDGAWNTAIQQASHINFTNNIALLHSVFMVRDL